MAEDRLNGGEAQYSPLEVAYFEYLALREEVVLFNAQQEDTAEAIASDLVAFYTSPENKRKLTVEEYEEREKSFTERRERLRNNPTDRYAIALNKVCGELFRDRTKTAESRFALYVAFNWATTNATDGVTDPVEVAKQIEERITQVTARLEPGQAVVTIADNKHYPARVGFGVVDDNGPRFERRGLDLAPFMSSTVVPSSEHGPINLIKPDKGKERLIEHDEFDDTTNLTIIPDSLNHLNRFDGPLEARQLLVGKEEIREYIEADAVENRKRFDVYVAATANGIEIGDLPEDLEEEKQAFINKNAKFVANAIALRTFRRVANEFNKATSLYTNVAVNEIDQVKQSSKLMQHVLYRIGLTPEDFVERIDNLITEIKERTPLLRERMDEIDLHEELAELFDK